MMWCVRGGVQQRRTVRPSMKQMMRGGRRCGQHDRRAVGGLECRTLSALALSASLAQPSGERRTNSLLVLDPRLSSRFVGCEMVDREGRQDGLDEKRWKRFEQVARRSKGLIWMRGWTVLREERRKR